MDSYSRVAIICCQTSMTLHVRVVLLGEGIVPVGTCEITIASSTSDIDIVILGLTCSPSGVLSFIGVFPCSSVWHIGILCYRLAWYMGDISTRIHKFVPCLHPHFRKPSAPAVYHPQQQKAIGKVRPLRRILGHLSRPPRCISGRDARYISSDMGPVLWSPFNSTINAHTIRTSFSTSKPHRRRRRTSTFDCGVLTVVREKNCP